MNAKRYPLSVVSTLTGIKVSSLKRLCEHGLIQIVYEESIKRETEIDFINPKITNRVIQKTTGDLQIQQSELTRFQTWLEEHPEIERDLNNDPVIGIDQLIKDAGYSEITLMGMYENGQINITGLTRTDSKGIISGYVTRLEYERILDLARSQQSKPTYEQLEAEIIELKAENECLHGKLRSNPTETSEHPNSLNKSKALIQALYQLANKPSHKQISNKAEELGYTVSSDTITNRLK